MNFDKQIKSITTKRLILRPFHKSDAENVTRLCNNYNLFKNTLTLPYPYTIDHALTWIENHADNFHANKLYEFAITDKKSGELYGAIALSNNQKFQNGEIAYWIGEEYWGNGYATEAAEAILHFAFIEKQYHRVYARYFHTNLASGKVMQKLGMKQEGILKEHVKKEGIFVDLVYYGIIK